MQPVQMKEEWGTAQVLDGTAGHWGAGVTPVLSQRSLPQRAK